jgi:5-hydroxyisourate hydrolase-like protein (transthyretin family)
MPSMAHSFEVHRVAARLLALVAALTSVLVLGALLVPGPADAASPTPTTLQLHSDAEAVPYGTQVRLTARLRRADTSAALGNELIRFETRPAEGGTWTELARVTTGTDGRASTATVPRRHRAYRAVYAGSARWAAARSGARTVRVSQTVTASLGRGTIWLGRATTLSGRVTPGSAGASVRLQRRVDDAWRTLETGATGADGSYRFRLRPSRRGTFTYRVVRPATSTLDRGVSRRRTLTVRGYAFPITPPGEASYSRAHHDYPATDIFAACGTTVVSPTAGRVQELSRRDTWDPKIDDGATRGGLYVSIVGTDGVRHYLSHFKTIEAGIAPGTLLAARQRLGTVGRTGSARGTPCHVHYGISPPCGSGDWQVRRGVIWPWRYLDAWKAGNDRSPRKEVLAWAEANPSRCPGR